MTNNKYSIGFIDEDKDWILKFKRFATERFNVVTFDLSEETTIEKLITEIRESSIDCLIVDFELKESELIQFNGDIIVDAIRKKTPFFPIFVLTNQQEDYVLNEVEDNDIVYIKSQITDNQNNFAIRINNKIERYYSKIEYANQEIERLFQLKTERALTPTEEEQLTDHYIFLDKIYPDEKVLPSHLIRPESISQLNVFVENTKKILEELKKQK